MPRSSMKMRRRSCQRRRRSSILMRRTAGSSEGGAGEDTIGPGLGLECNIAELLDLGMMGAVEVRVKRRRIKKTGTAMALMR